MTSQSRAATTTEEQLQRRADELQGEVERLEKLMRVRCGLLDEVSRELTTPLGRAIDVLDRVIAVTVEHGDAVRLRSVRNWIEESKSGLTNMAKLLTSK